MKQIYKLSAGDTLFKEHLESISLLTTKEEDTYHLRQLFVDEALVVRRLDNVIHWIKLYPVSDAI